MDTAYADRRNARRVDAAVDAGDAPRVRLETKELRAEPDVDLLWREEIEDTLSLAEEALSRTATSTDEPDPKRRFLAAGEPLRAPLAGKEEVPPAEVAPQSGFVPVSKGGLIDQLERRAFSVARTDVPVRADIELSREPVVIAYEFDRPVTAAEGIDGELFVADDGGASRGVPFQPGVPARRIVQRIEPENFPGNTAERAEPLQLRIEAGEARWSRAE